MRLHDFCCRELAVLGAHLLQMSTHHSNASADIGAEFCFYSTRHDPKDPTPVCVRLDCRRLYCDWTDLSVLLWSEGAIHHWHGAGGDVESFALPTFPRYCSIHIWRHRIRLVLVSIETRETCTCVCLIASFSHSHHRVHERSQEIPSRVD